MKNVEKGKVWTKDAVYEGELSMGEFGVTVVFAVKAGMRTYGGKSVWEKALIPWSAIGCVTLEEGEGKIPALGVLEDSDAAHGGKKRK